MPTIEPYRPFHLPQLTELINAHLGSLLPGWALPAEYIASHLEREPGQYVIDPWVIERATLCAFERQRLVAAAHLLRYGHGREVSDSYRDTGDIAWFLFWPGQEQAAAALLEEIHLRMESWGVVEEGCFDSGLPIPLFAGVPDTWPHIAGALSQAGYLPAVGHDEAVFAGWLEPIPLPGPPPVEGFRVQRRVGAWSACFAAMREGEELGWCEVITDLSKGGALPALRGWGELGEMEVEEGWRNRGIGAWLLRHGIAWLRLGGCDRIALSVAAESEAAGAGRFYTGFGWQPLVRLTKGWRRGGGVMENGSISQ